jgi:hypothetical protein
VSLPVPEKELLISAMLPSGATQTIRRSPIVPVATAHAVSFRPHTFFGVEQSFDWNVAMLSAKAAVDLPRSNIEAKKLRVISEQAKAKRNERLRKKDSLLEIARIFGYLIDEKIDFVTPLRRGLIRVD